jgi:hypothetical protein
MLPVTLQRKNFRLLLAAALLVVTAGCSGINASHSVSPASFFLPGLLKADPPPMTNDVTVPQLPAVKQVALAR